ncbi:MAG: hypothetical protein KAV00_01860 [Phycisphaerae bacterium]|nr:hypothetical protein [Phycisphaerae bacterium]
MSRLDLLFGGDAMLLKMTRRAKAIGLYAPSTYGDDIAHSLVRDLYRSLYPERQRSGVGWHVKWNEWATKFFPKWYSGDRRYRRQLNVA